MSHRRKWARLTAAGGLLGLLAACTSAPASAPQSVAGSRPAASTIAGSPAPPTRASASAQAPTSTSAQAPTTDAPHAPPTSAPPTSSPTPATPSAPPAPAASVSATPALGSTGISPSAPISIAATHGRIASLTMTNTDGKVVQGSLSGDGSRWTLGEDLGYDKTYTVTGIATGADGRSVPIDGNFSTVSPDDEVNAMIAPADGEVVGIAESIIVHFPSKPENTDAVEKALTVTTTPHVEGAWAWIHHDGGWGIDWRPKNYWPAGTKVHVDAKLYGVEFSPGEFGAGDVTSDFTIGRSQVVYADANSYQIVIKQGCTAMKDPGSCRSTVATYDASYGKGDRSDSKDPNLVTRSGIHVVSELLSQHIMVGSPPYTYHSVEYWDARISDNGEFIHENPNTVGDQGNTNVSHGCINLSPKNAESYFKSALLGDPVEVTGTSVQLSAADGDVFDWTFPWSEWLNLPA